MLKILCLLICFFVNLVAFCERNKSDLFIITGEVIGKNIKSLTCTYRDNKGKLVKQFCPLVKRHFKIAGYINGAVEIAIASNLSSPSVDDPNWVSLLIQPGKIELILLENRFKFFNIKGSSIQEKYEVVNESKKRIYDQQKLNSEQLTKIDDSLGYYIKINDSLKISGLFNVRNKLVGISQELTNQQNEIEVTYLKNNYDDFLSAYFLEKQFAVYKMDNSIALNYCNKFSKRVKETYWIQSILKGIQRIEGSRIGAKGKNFVGKDSRKEKFEFLKFRKGKIVLLEFWASWCIPCREAIPHLDKALLKYKIDGFAVVAISTDKDKTAWLKAIQELNISHWVNLISNDNYTSRIDLEASENYDIPALPTTYLIDREGVIRGKWIGYEKDNIEDLNSKLKILFGF